jgi:predicted O-methyltransferase YrrM
LKPETSLQALYPEATGLAVDFGLVTFRESNLDPSEQFSLVAIARIRHPATIFEIGTFDWATTLLLARNLPSARILTLDLNPADAGAGTVQGEIDNLTRGGVGSCFAGMPEANRITQLLGDSRTFDFSPWHGAVDLVVIDAGHDYENAAADTATAFRLLRRGGAIVWDDYTHGWPGVVRAVHECGRDFARIAGTHLAVYDEAASELGGS